MTSKDSDFRQLAFVHGPPPRVIWLRAGDATTATIANELLDHVETIEAFVANEDEALLVIPFAS